jgi:hypothetical protein
MVARRLEIKLIERKRNLAMDAMHDFHGEKLELQGLTKI